MPIKLCYILLMIYCKKCGTANKNDSVICSFCNQIIYEGATRITNKNITADKVIDIWLAEENNQRVKYIHKWTVTFFILMFISFLEISFMLIRHSHIWHTGLSKGLYFFDTESMVFFIVIFILTAVNFLITVFMFLFSTRVKNNLRTTIQKRIGNVSPLYGSYLIFITVSIFTVISDLITFIYSVSIMEMVAVAGGGFELAAFLIRMSLDILIIPLSIIIIKTINKYNHNLYKLPNVGTLD